ncbi:MAG TPA: ABC transporter substrate-binding protein [Clostridiales bacterium]|nr:ABC transporter substrate-binding protein [Clostridiales bacterium]
MNTKQALSTALALILTLSLTSCGKASAVSSTAESFQIKESTRTFTDSVGRKVELPAQIDRVALSGPLAQIFVFALAPHKLVGISSGWNESAAEFLDAQYYNLPVLGQIYGGRGELNLETLLSSGAQVVIDVGEPKDGIVEDLDALQEQTGIPFVHITAPLDSMGAAYRKLGELLGMPEEADMLAAYCEETYDKVCAMADRVEKVNLLYITGTNGLNVIAKNSYHSEVIDLLSNNLAVVDQPSSRGTGNEVDLEQILNWNPDYIIFAPESIYKTVADDPLWQNVAAIQNGNYFEVPEGPYNWMGFPPSVQRLLGMLWMAKVLYPAAANFDLYEEAARYYQLFYHCNLTWEQYHALVAHSIGQKEG